MSVTHQKIESRALRDSAWGYLFMALLGGLFFYLAKSEAILLDGVYSFISLLMTFLAQRVSRLVQTPKTVTQLRRLLLHQQLGLLTL